MIAGRHSMMLRKASAKVIYVDKNATGAGDGTSWADAFTGIQDGLNAASDGNGWIVKIGAGTYTLSSTLTPWPNTTISGSGRGVTIIDGNNSIRGFNCYTNLASFCNFEHLTIQNCVTRLNAINNENFSKCGAAIFGYGAGFWSRSMSNTNSAPDRFRNRSGGYLYDCIFKNTNASSTNNYSVAGCVGGFKWVVNCEFDNTKCFNSPFKCWRLANCIFHNISIANNACATSPDDQNTTPLSDENVCVLMNCTFFGNNATSNKTITGNQSSRFVNCLFYNNGTNKLDNQNSSPVLNCYCDSSMTFSSSTNPKPTSVSDVGVVSTTNPHLVAGSVCIGAGTTDYLPYFADCPVPIDVDMDGNTFVSGGSIDVGAFAFAP